MTQDTDAERVLTPTNVTRVFAHCLFANEGEEITDAVTADGILTKVEFHPGRLAEHRDEIRALLDELPGDFHVNGGGGMSFLNACMNCYGEQWTGEHRVMEMLFLLGMATGAVTCLMPRSLWEALPGGMPYYLVAAKS